MSIYVDIKKRFGDFTLEMQFEAENEIVGILGASGSGKSMTLRCIAGIVTPDSGEIVLNGKTLYNSAKKINLTPQQRNVGLMFQSYALFPNMTVAQNIAVGIKDKAQRTKLVGDYIELLRLQGLVGRYPSQLSGGQQQRVALARMMASSPDILLLDEPFSALDRHLRFSIEQEFADALGCFDGTVLLVSHNVGEIYQYCATTAVLAQGKIAEYESTEELFYSPRTVEGARLTGCKNLSAVKAIGHNTVFAEDWNLQFILQQELPDGITAIGIREADLTLTNFTGECGVSVTVTNVKYFPQFAVLNLSPKRAQRDIYFTCSKALVGDYLTQSERGELYLSVGPDQLLFLSGES
ncbi:ATP-binding cassette domain-containing protein [Hydrogenoanaerobacterium sp.]|uniref:sulfate/molybdate ABC transporter ATP-binding protein n=1 Tax=Hydrogenoanaerobacterium sp. TaxID=2953763 RepID=UPI0028A1E3D3|nr:ATP-binding cassette domain-containing protein [Hydrogenoanaerobacterium sp.]